jgi:glutathione S-transferase
MTSALRAWSGRAAGLHPRETQAMSIKLHFAPGTRATRIAFLLEELGIPWEKLPVDIAQRQHKTAAYLALNPNGVVPTLEDGETVVFESLAIALYLADRFPEKGLAPALDSPLRGRYMSWMVWSMTCLEPAIGQVYLEQAKPAEQQSAAAIAAGREKFKEAAGVLSGQLSRPYLLGDSMSAVDIQLGCVLAFAGMLGLLEGFDVLAEYTGRITGRPAFRKAMA